MDGNGTTWNSLLTQNVHKMYEEKNEWVCYIIF